MLGKTGIDANVFVNPPHFFPVRSQSSWREGQVQPLFYTQAVERAGTQQTATHGKDRQQGNTCCALRSPNEVVLIIPFPFLLDKIPLLLSGGVFCCFACLFCGFGLFVFKQNSFKIYLIKPQGSQLHLLCFHFNDLLFEWNHVLASVSNDTIFAICNSPKWAYSMSKRHSKEIAGVFLSIKVFSINKCLKFYSDMYIISHHHHPEDYHPSVAEGTF